MENIKDTILSHYEVRKTNTEKTIFIDYIKSRLTKSGYDSKDITVESSGSGLLKNRNIIVGNPKTAEIFITAHYDTCAVLPFPNVMAPTNPVLYLICQTLVAFILIALSMIIVIPVALITKHPLITYYVFLFSMIFLMFYLLFGYRNKHTANDNTSGVITITKILETLPIEKRNKFCVVYFDNEEKGLIGSSNFAKKHKADVKGKLLLNFDCVGDGNYVASFAKKSAMQDDKYVLLIETLNENAKDVGIHSLNKRVLPMMFPSDNIHFKKGIGFCGLKKSIIGLYAARIHTPFDTKCSGANIEFLVKSISEFVSKL